MIPIFSCRLVSSVVLALALCGAPIVGLAYAAETPAGGAGGGTEELSAKEAEALLEQGN